MSGKSRREERLALVEGAFRSFSDRYLGAEPDFDVTYHVVLGDVGHVWEVRCNAAAHVHTLLRPGMDFGGPGSTNAGDGGCVTPAAVGLGSRYGSLTASPALA